jgi:hypothetical protein
MKAARRRQQQAALLQPTNPTALTSERPSIGQLVLQRMDRLGIKEQIEDETQHPIPIKVMPIPESQELPISTRTQTLLQPEALSEEKPYSAHWPECPKTCDSKEWRRALENKDYYESKQLADDCRKPWFQYPRYDFQYSEFVYCTPDMAKALLDHMPVNRGAKRDWIEALTRDVLNHRWLQTHESIAINKLGNMHDGQHRAQAIINANIGWPLYFTFNVPPEAIYVTDSGERRKVNEKLGLLFPDIKITNKTAALCRSMMWGLTNRNIKYSESEIAEFAIKHQKVIDWVTTQLRTYRADLQAVIGKALLWWGETHIKPFVDRLRTVQFLGEGDPAKALYLWLAKSKQEGRRNSYTGPLVFYQKALSAIQAHAAGRETRKIIRKEDDIFEWLPGWVVPANAPSNGKVFIEESEE